VLAYDRDSTLWDAARLLSVGEEGYAYRNRVGSAVRALPEFLERPNYFDVSVYGAPGESVSRFMHRGSRVAIDGRLEWREWETAEQERRQAVSIVADTVQFLDSPGERAQLDAGEREPAGDGEGDAPVGEEGRELVGVGAGVEEDDLVF
jgi:single-strand DNA-binding protein